MDVISKMIYFAEGCEACGEKKNTVTLACVNNAEICPKCKKNIYAFIKTVRKKRKNADYEKPSFRHQKMEYLCSSPQCLRTPLIPGSRCGWECALEYCFFGEATVEQTKIIMKMYDIKPCNNVKCRKPRFIGHDWPSAYEKKQFLYCSPEGCKICCKKKKT